MPRAAPIQLLARAADATDPEIRTLHDKTRTALLTGMTAFAGHLHTGGHLRAGMTIDEARDVLWTINAAEVYELLVLERGWSTERYRDFVANTLIASLLGALGVVPPRR